MRGTNVKGYLVGELLGSGRSGLLYSAVHVATRAKAIIRVVTTEDRVETEVFRQEAQSLLGGEDGVLLRATLDDGRIVHLVANEGRAPHPLAAHASGPGDATRAERTARLPRMSVSTPSSEKHGISWLLLVGCAALGASLTLVIVMLVRPAQRQPVVVAPSRQPEPIVVDAGALDRIVEVKPTQPVITPPAALAAPKSPPKRARPAKVVELVEEEPCEPNERWMRNVGKDLSELEGMAFTDPAVEREFEKVAPVLKTYLTTTTTAQCERIQKTLDKLKERLNQLPAK